VLSLSAHRILSRLEVELAHHGGTDNGKLACTYDHFEEYGVHRQAIAPAIRALIALGFIEITEPGCAGVAGHRSPNLFRLTHRPTANEGATDEWRWISTIEQAESCITKARANRTTRSWRPTRKKHFPVVENVPFPVVENVPFAPVCSTETTTTSPVVETTTTSISREDARQSEADKWGRPLSAARFFTEVDRAIAAMTVDSEWYPQCVCAAALEGLGL
jgi:hypothetical protein